MDWDEKMGIVSGKYYDGWCDECGDTACVKFEDQLRCTICGNNCVGHEQGTEAGRADAELCIECGRPTNDHFMHCKYFKPPAP